MSNSLLNIQEITSRTFNNDPSIMQTSIQHFEHHQNHPNFTKSDLHNMSLKKTIHNNFEDVVRDLRIQNQNYKKEINTYKNRMIEMHRGNGGHVNQENFMRQMMQELNNKEEQNKELKKNYLNAITNLKETIEKNEILSKEVGRLAKKLKESELNYSREQQVYHKSQNLISNLSITKSNYQIELVNMKDSLVILEMKNKEIIDTNEQYQEKLALISQQIQRLRGMLEKTKKQNEVLRFNVENQGLKSKKYESQYMEQKSILERLRIQNRDLNNKASALSQQLREYHEKLSYKETVLNDMKEGQSKVEKHIKDKEAYIKELEHKLKDYEQSFKVMEQEYSKQKSSLLQERNGYIQQRNAYMQQKNSYVQEIGKLRARINEQAASSKEIILQREGLENQYEKLMQNFNYLKEQQQANVSEKNALFQELKSVAKERDFLLRQKQALIQEMDHLSTSKQDSSKEIQYLKTELLRWQQKFKDTEQDFKRYEQKQRVITKQCQNKIELINQQRISQLNVKVSQLNQCKFELAGRINEINQLRSEIAGRSSELIKIKEETISQSTIFDHSRKDFDDKVREKNEIINQCRGKINNLEKLIEQSRRERDLIFQQKNSLTLSLQKAQQAIQSKNNELRNCALKLDQFSKSLKQQNQNFQRKNLQIQNYKRVINDTEFVIRDKEFKLKDAQNRINNAINEIQRLNKSLREKQGIIIDLSNRCKEYAKIAQDKDDQMSRLKNITEIQRQNHEKINLTLSYAQQSKGNFQLFIKEIERLNQVVLAKESQSKNLKFQLNKLLQKIDIIAQEQLKILKAVQMTYSTQSLNNTEIKNQFIQLKDFIGRVNQNTNTTLRQMHQQTTNISNTLHRSENSIREGNSQINEKLLQANKLLSIKQGEIMVLKRETEQQKIKIRQYQQNIVHQEQIFQKILELSRENANVREQLAHLASQRQFEVQEKNSSITNLQSQVQKLQILQGKELAELKQYSKQKEKAFEETKERLKKENDVIKEKVRTLEELIKNRENVIYEKQRIINDLQQRLRAIQTEVDQKMKDVEAISRMLQEHTFSSQSSKAKSNPPVQHDPSSSFSQQKIEMYQREIQKLQKILEIREQQYSKNEQSFEKLKNELKKYKNIQIQLQSSKQKLTQCTLQLQQTISQKKFLQSKLKQAQSAIHYFQQGANSKSLSRNRIFIDIKTKNQTLEKEIRIIYAKLRESQAKLAMAKEQINNLLKEHYRLIDGQREGMNKLQEIQILQRQKNELSQKFYLIQNDLQKALTENNKYRIQNNFLHSQNEQIKIFLQTYEHKTGQVQREYQKLKEVYVTLNTQYSKLRLKNHEFEIQLKKAQMLQQKIQVLNNEINRLSIQNIDLNSQISSCKLALGDESTLQRRNQELLTLIVILMAEVENLRNCVQVQENELKNNRVLQLGKYRN